MNFSVQNIVLDYYPFGSTMSGRSFSSPNYRYGFNGMEKDNSASNGVEGAHLDFGARIYDSRLGRWMSPDPFAWAFNSVSPYSFAINSPIFIVDPDGGIVTYASDVSEAFRTKMDKIINYLKLSKTFRRMYKKLHRSKNIHIIKEIKLVNDDGSLNYPGSELVMTSSEYELLKLGMPPMAPMKMDYMDYDLITESDIFDKDSYDKDYSEYLTKLEEFEDERNVILERKDDNSNGKGIGTYLYLDVTDEWKERIEGLNLDNFFGSNVFKFIKAHEFIHSFFADKGLNKRRIEDRYGISKEENRAVRKTNRIRRQVGRKTGTKIKKRKAYDRKQLKRKKTNRVIFNPRF